MAETTWHNRITGYGTEAPDQLVANPRNWRVHPTNQQAALKGSLTELGWIQNVIVNQRTGFVLDGHARVGLALRHNQPDIPVTYVDLSEEDEVLALATLDPISAMAGADKDQLESLLAEIATQDEALLDLMAGLGKEHGINLGRGGLTDPDAVPEPPAEPITSPGDLWLLGQHRLLCGDATAIADVASVMDGERAEMTLTDPPYNVGIDYGPSSSDRRPEYAQFCRDWFAACPSDGAVFTPGIVNLALWYVDVMPPKWLCSWRKVNQCSNSGIGGFNTWEPILVYGKVPKRVGHDSWDIPVAQADVDHPVPKTVAAWATFMAAFTTDTALVYDPFLGSGTTLIVAEQLGRRCYGLEIDPHYCDVIVARWEQFTGNTASRERIEDAA